jgi:pimeloyl-ACP methyl ester carboxylesterase
MTVIMATHHIARIVIGCLTGGIVVALALVVGPLAGAQEHVITGTALLAFASSWALLATLSIVSTEQPQRWAAMPAGFMALAGAGLLALAPNGSVIDMLGWVWPPLLLALIAMTVIRVNRDLHSRTRSWVVYPLFAVYALCALGGSYQTAREFFDRRTHSAPGQLVDVGGHRLHLHCIGSGTPTVILESGLGESAAYWGWISTAVARETTVCGYDRAGRGWSDSASAPQNGITVATDLHILLDRAHVPGPFVLVAHSSGAAYVRIFAGRYPEQVAGMVLLDGQPAEAFESLPSFPAFYSGFRRISALFPSFARLGVGRLVYHADFVSLPAQARDMQRLNYSSARFYRSLRDEFAELPTSLDQARSFQNFGDRPLVVVTAARDALTGWLPLQEAMARLSTNSSHRVVPYTHDALVNDQTGAQTSSQAIRDVVHAVRFATPLKTS